MSDLKDTAKRVGRILGKAHYTTQRAVAEAGTLGGKLQEGSAELGERIGELYGHAARTVEGAIAKTPSLKEAYAAGRTDPAQTAQKGRVLGANAAGKVREAVRDLGDTVRETAREAAIRIRDGIKDYAAPEKRHVTVGNASYFVKSESLTEIRRVGDYMQTALARVPPDAPGRSELCCAIGLYAVKSDLELQKAASDGRLTESNALSYALMK